MEGHGKAAIRHPTTCMLEGGCTLHGGKASLLLAQVLNKRLRMGGPGGASYYSFSPHARWRVIVLDGYDVSLLGWPPEHPLHQRALQILNERNPNQACRCFSWSLYTISLLRENLHHACAHPNRTAP